MGTDYQCPDCGCGFPKSDGKRNFERRFSKFHIDEYMYWDIVCPDCGHVFGGNEAGEKYGSEDDPNFAKKGTGEGFVVIGMFVGIGLLLIMLLVL